MNTTMIVENVAGAVIDKNETDHDDSLQMSAEYDCPSRQSVACRAPKMTRSPVARRVKSVMVAAALMMSAQGAYASNNAADAAAAFQQYHDAAVAYNTLPDSTPVNKLNDKYNEAVAGLTRLGVDVHEQSDLIGNVGNLPTLGDLSNWIGKDLSVPAKTNPTDGAALTAENLARTEPQAVALADARQLSNDKAIQPTKEYGDAMTKANQLRTESQAVAKADAQQADADRQAAAKAQGDALTSANQIRTQQQMEARTGATLTAANADRTAAQNTALNNARGNALTAANQTRTQSQTDSRLGAALTAANVSRTQMQADADRQAAEKAQGDALTAENQARTQQQVQAGAQAMMVSLTASKMASANSTINVSAGSLGDMPVKTAHGETVLASSLPADTQVSKPYNSALFGSVTRTSNGGNNSNSGEGSHGGTGNGNENAQASHSAGNFSTEHDHIGGGHTGGGFHY